MYICIYVYMYIGDCDYRDSACGHSNADQQANDAAVHDFYLQRTI